MITDVRMTLARVRNAIESLGGDVAVFDVAPPATAARIDAVERDIDRTIPAALRQLFEQSAGVRMFWILEGKRVPKSLGEGLSGSIDLSLDGLATDLVNWSGWREAFEHPTGYGWPAELTLQDYDELFPVVAAANGDQLVVADPQHNTSDAVMYLNHEQGDFNFVVLADTLEGFLDSWIRLGCPGPEWWVLAPFLDEETAQLSLDTRRSKTWLKALSAA